MTMDPSKATNTDDNKKRTGRPAVGVTKDNALAYWRVIKHWIEQLKLDRWLKDVEQSYKAQQAMTELSIADDDFAQRLNDWCQAWLSQEGWKRLQANVRQSHYVKGSVTKNRESRSRERKRNLQVEASTAARLRMYAEHHNVTLNNALLKLLDEEEKKK
ncbi:hypothetical protein ACH42_07015 [Endozoicomonas sp. (ex Bugula neritina AB1)]|nr:hypothetical protein ACH42_07015 [Endozoicomonas sp. (ex Bugula neritina AB1)]